MFTTSFFVDQVNHLFLKFRTKMGKKHLIKIVTLFMRVSTKIMQRSEQQALNKFSTRKGDIFWLYHPKSVKLIDTGLPVLVVALSVFP